ncbi:MAG: conjugal transfer protein TraH [Proteobacteria bacterium]|nr:conjugal transfer protein TraH [Pseudomonadota bacterium]
MGIVTPALSGEFIDDWIKQKSVSGPSTFNSQRRGVVSGGSAHMRWDVSNDYLVSASLPKFQKGCGGIDIFMGGIGFLEPDYLIEKLKKIMGDAGATFFFKIALNTLAEPIAKEIDSLEAIISRLNAIQLDDCKASQTVVASFWDDDKKEINANRQALLDYYTSSGVEKLYQEVVKSGSDKSTKAAGIDQGVGKPDMVKNCPGPLKNTFFKAGSLLENLATERGFSTAYIEYIRAIAGDIRVDANLDYTYLPPCEQMSPDNLVDIYNGALYIRKTIDDQCYQVTNIQVDSVTYSSIVDYIGTELTGIASNIIAKTQLSGPQIAFLGTLPNFIYRGIQTQVEAMEGDAVPSDIAAYYTDIASVSYTYYILNDLYKLLLQIVSAANTIVDNASGSQTGIDQKDCQLALKDKAYSQLMQMRQQIKEYIKAVDKDYDAKINTYINLMQIQMITNMANQTIKNGKYDSIKRASSK